jgi:hypothetical protein
MQEDVMDSYSKALATVLIGATVSLVGTAGAAPIGASSSLREAIPQAVEAVQWRGGGYWGGGWRGGWGGGAIATPLYADDYDYYCPPYYGYGYAPTYYRYGYGYGSGIYGGYAPRYRPDFYIAHRRYWGYR